MKLGVSACCCVNVHVCSEILSSPSEMKLFSFLFFNKCGALLGGKPPDYTCNLERLIAVVQVCVSSIHTQMYL